MDAEPGAPPASGAAVEREQIVDTWGRPSVASSPLRSLSIRFVTRAFGYQRAGDLEHEPLALLPSTACRRDADRRRRPPAAELCRAGRSRSDQQDNRPSHVNIKAAPLSGL